MVLPSTAEIARYTCSYPVFSVVWAQETNDAVSTAAAAATPVAWFWIAWRTVATWLKLNSLTGIFYSSFLNDAETGLHPDGGSCGETAHVPLGINARNTAAVTS